MLASVFDEVKRGRCGLRHRSPLLLRRRHRRAPSLSHTRTSPVMCPAAHTRAPGARERERENVGEGVQACRSARPLQPRMTIHVCCLSLVLLFEQGVGIPRCSLPCGMRTHAQTSANDRARPLPSPPPLHEHLTYADAPPGSPSLRPIDARTQPYSHTIEDSAGSGCDGSLLFCSAFRFSGPPFPAGSQHAGSAATTTTPAPPPSTPLSWSVVSSLALANLCCHPSCFFSGLPTPQDAHRCVHVR